MSVALTDRGEVKAFHLATGTPVEAGQIDLGGKPVTSFGRTLVGNDVAFGFADGTVRFGKINVQVQVLPGDAMPAEAQPIPGSADRSDGKAVYARIAGGQIRRVGVEIGRAHV